MKCPKCGANQTAKVESDKEIYYECRNPNCWYTW